METPTVIQVIDVTSDGWKIRLSDGSVVDAPHTGPTPHLGEKFSVETGEAAAPETPSWPIGGARPVVPIQGTDGGIV
jgi:nitrite reductase/ring-hydroxylating ferredoxin subunit